MPAEAATLNQVMLYDIHTCPQLMIPCQSGENRA